MNMLLDALSLGNKYTELAASFKLETLQALAQHDAAYFALKDAGVATGDCLEILHALIHGVPAGGSASQARRDGGNRSLPELDGAGQLCGFSQPQAENQFREV